MTLDPRTQLAQTMVLVKNQRKTTTREKVGATQERKQRETEHAQHSMEALTKALLDPCTTVQEAMLDSLVQRSEKEPLPATDQEKGFRSTHY